MTAYYNENNPYAAQWLRNLIAANLIAPGYVDDRSIKDVQPDDLKGYTQCHFFAGIGGWSYALRLALWPDDRPVWTGSCPCQPFSSIGKASRQQDERHLSPTWTRLIRESKPPVIFGEQVDEAVAGGWADDLFSELEKENYACASAILPAYAVEEDHERNRLYFVAHSAKEQRLHESKHKETKKRLHNNKANWKANTWDASEPKVYSIHDGLPSAMGSFEAYGNAIHAGVAAAYIQAYCEAVSA